jgi:hypothetical protein
MKANISIFSLILLIIAGCARQMSWPELTKQSESPNRRFIVEIRENIKDTTDRHFRILLINTEENTKKSVFLSPDEGEPGTEEIYWSPDSNWFLVTGRKFAVALESILPNGERLYFLYDLKRNKAYCNSVQIIGAVNFSTNDLSRIGFTKPS